MRRTLLRIIMACGFMMGVWAVYLALEIGLYNESVEHEADAAIVLGAAVQGNRPSPVFEQRIAHALDLLQSGKVEKVIFTGGRAPGAAFSEAEVARNYALDHGAPVEALYMERFSTTTLENLRLARHYLEQENLDSVLIVSDPLHMRRAMTIANDLDINAFPSPTPTSQIQSPSAQMRFLLREMFFYQKYLLLRS